MAGGSGSRAATAMRSRGHQDFPFCGGSGRGSGAGVLLPEMGSGTRWEMTSSTSSLLNEAGTRDEVPRPSWDEVGTRWRDEVKLLGLKTSVVLSMAVWIVRSR